jgi:hypothetical protein
LRLGLLDLAAPQFLVGGLLGPDLGKTFHDIVSFLRVSDLESTWDETGIVYSSNAKFTGQGDASPVPRHSTPGGSFFEWKDVNIQFRLTIPRSGASDIKSRIDTAASLAGPGSDLDQLRQVLDDLGAVPAAGGASSDYPGFRFRLELLVTLVTFHLPKDKLVPARIADDGWLERDPALSDVQLHLPKLAFVITKGDSLTGVDADFDGWGVNSLDDPVNPAAAEASLQAITGEVFAMVPPLALSSDGRWGFGIEKIVLDFSGDFTPPEILDQFGAGDDFRGIWCPNLRFFHASRNSAGFAFDVRAHDLLIDFDKGVSGEIAADIMQRNTAFKVLPAFVAGDKLIDEHQGHKVDPPVDKPHTTVIRGSEATVAANGRLQLSITGGEPPYAITVTKDGQALPAQEFNNNPNLLTWPLGGTAAGTAAVRVLVADNSAQQFGWDEEIRVILNDPLEKPKPGPPTYPDPEFTAGAGTDGYTLHTASAQPDPNTVVLVADPSNAESATANGSALSISASGEIAVPVTPGGPAVTVTATWPTVAAEPQPPVDIGFAFDIPFKEEDVPGEAARIVARDQADPQHPLQNLILRIGGGNVHINGRASFNGDKSQASVDHNITVSTNRATALHDAMVEIATAQGLDITGKFDTPTHNGFAEALGAGAKNDHSFEDAIATLVAPSVTPPPATRQATVKRGTAIPPPALPTIATPTPTEPPRAPWLHRISFRVRLERWPVETLFPVLAEVSGEIDLRTADEEAADKVRSATGITDSTGNPIVTSPSATTKTPPPGDGTTDFRLTISFDTATDRLTEEIVIGAAESDTNGLAHTDSDGAGRIRNVEGALLVFAPLLAASVDTAVTASGDSATVPIVVAAAEIALAATLGLSGVLKTRRLILFGVDAKVTEQLGGPTAVDLNLLVDYGVEFAMALNAGPLHIHSADDKPFRVRYRGLGFRADFGGGDTLFRPVFDTSKGYELNLGDSGGIVIDPPFDKLLTMVGARVARTNPLTIEFDFGMKVNLGVITVDQLRVTALFRDPDPPSITLQPTAISVNIPKTVTGKGLLDLRDGIKGALDVTVVPAKLRVQAGLALQPITSGARSVTAVLATLGVEFPNPVPLFGTGLGLYGLLGLFAMHFKRNENPAAQVPALDWFNQQAHGDATDITAWVPEIDRWNFGIGAVAGTLEGGTIVNAKGMLLLELPGPRILIFVKAQILTTRPDTKGPVENLGLLGVVDVNLELGKITIGIAINYEAKDLIKLKVPVEELFVFNDVSKWHLNIGSIGVPASAEILGVYKAKGYLMFAGDEIAKFPTPLGEITLPGLAIALGIRAALVLGDEDSGLFLKVSAALDASLVFSPFHVHGSLELKGELRLFIVSISAHASLEVDAPDPTFVSGEACGEVDFFFFSVEGCVHVDIGTRGGPLPAPPLVVGMSLQSRSPALVDGQGTDAPIDASLGDAKPVNDIGTTHDPDLIVVPVDAVPVLNLHAAPILDAGFATFTVPLDQAPRSFPEGWIDQGGGRSVRYRVHALEISPPLPPPDPAAGLPKATWQAFTGSAKGADNSVALALFSWEADPTPRAVVRSTELTTRVGDRWEGVCDPVAPPAPVLWTFNQQPLGPSRLGWLLKGIALPDPSSTRRSSVPDTTLAVHGPAAPPLGELFGQLAAAGGLPQVEPAEVIGDDPRLSGLTVGVGLPPDGRVLQLPFQHPVSVPVILLRQPAFDVLDLPEAFRKLIDPEPERVIVESGPLQGAILLLAMTQELARSSLVRLRAFDQKDNLLREDPVNTLSPKTVVTPADLPPDWTSPTSPWTPDVSKVLTFLRVREPSLARLLVTYAPPDGTARFEVSVHERPVGEMPPAVLVCVIELLRTSEITRETHDDGARTSEITTIEGALDAGRPRPLLVPDTRYTISLTFSADARQALPPNQGGGFDESDGSPQTQRFTFVTANTAPPRLDPWVLATTPNADQPSHFADDPVRVIFNDASVVQLFNAYGKNLRAVVRKSNGNHPTGEPPLNAGALQAVRGMILTPYEDTLRHVIDTRQLGCIHVPPSESHQLFTVPVPLDRATAYTLEIETQDPPPPGIGPRVPLFRIAFTTSRFRTSAELAEVMRAGRTTHRALGAPIPSLPDAPTDKQLEDALAAAGLDALPPAGQPGFAYLWKASGPSFTLAAILIDSPEPLWRYRPEPTLLTEASDTGDIQHWALAPTAWLEVAETGTTAAARFIRAPGGARTLMMVAPGATAANLFLRQHELGVLQAAPAFADSPILSGALPASPPWAEEG